MSSNDATQEIKRSLTDVGVLCEKLGMLADRRGYQRQAGGFLVRCLAHEDRTPSCSVQLRHGVILWKCHSCGEGGDAISLVALSRGLTLRGDDFKQALICAAALGGMHGLVTELESGERRARAQPVARPDLPPEPERDYPPRVEVDALWDASLEFDDEATAWAVGRGLDAGQAEDVARRIPETGLPRWASYQRRSWHETGHRVIVPVFDAAGDRRSVRAIRVIEGESPKRLPPGGHKAAGLVMACDLAIGMLRGTYAPPRVLIVEGEPDFLVAATTSWEGGPCARIGITSGSWTEGFAARVPRNATVILGTHDDAAGEKYATAIYATLLTQTLKRQPWRTRVDT